MYIDTHCHLSSEDYDNIDVVISENRDAGIEKIIISGCTRDTIVESFNIASLYPDVYVTIGYHPSEASITTFDDIMLLEEQIKNDKVVGIGEIGLDYHYGKEDMEQQKLLFRRQIAMADRHQLPVVIHSRDATQDTIEILKEFPNVKGVIHCFSGSLEVAKIYISMGYLLGIGGVITFKNSNLYRVVEEIGLDSIVLETDSPYITPEPYRGQKNSSKYIPYIAKKLSEICNVSLEDVSKKTIQNTNRLFDLG